MDYKGKVLKTFKNGVIFSFDKVLGKGMYVSLMGPVSAQIMPMRVWHSPYNDGVRP